MGGAGARWAHRLTPQPMVRRPGRYPGRVPRGWAVRQSGVVPSVPDYVRAALMLNYNKRRVG